jgi:hypothetical protein
VAGERQDLIEAHERMLDRYAVEPESRFADVPSNRGRAHVLVSAALPAAELRVVGGGHAPWLTGADRVGPEVRRFLQQHEWA